MTLEMKKANSAKYRIRLVFLGARDGDLTEDLSVCFLAIFQKTTEDFTPIFTPKNGRYLFYEVHSTTSQWAGFFGPHAP